MRFGTRRILSSLMWSLILRLGEEAGRLVNPAHGEELVLSLEGGALDQPVIVRTEPIRLGYVGGGCPRTVEAVGYLGQNSQDALHTHIHLYETLMIPEISYIKQSDYFCRTGIALRRRHWYRIRGSRYA